MRATGRIAPVAILTALIATLLSFAPASADDEESPWPIDGDDIRPVGSIEIPFSIGAPTYRQSQETYNFIPYASCGRSWQADFDAVEYGATIRDDEYQFILETLVPVGADQDQFVRRFETMTVGADGAFTIQESGVIRYDPDRDYIIEPNSNEFPETATYVDAPTHCAELIPELREYRLWTTEPNPLVATITMEEPPRFVDDTAEAVLTVTNESDTAVTEIEFLDDPETVGVYWDDSVLELEGTVGELPTELSPGETATVTYEFTRVGEPAFEISTEIEAVHLERPVDAEATYEGPRAEDPIVGTFFRVGTTGTDGVVKVGETAPVRLRLTNESGKEITDLELVHVGTPAPDGMIPAADLRPASSPHPDSDTIRTLPEQLTASGLGSMGFMDLELEGLERGTATLSAYATAMMGERAIYVQVNFDWEVRQVDLKIDVSFDPPEQVQVESEDPEADPEPVEMTTTVEITNESGEELTDIRIEEFEVTRTFGTQQLFLDQVGGVRLTNWDKPGILLSAPQNTEDLPEPFDLGVGEKRTFHGDFIARDDGAIEFHASAVGKAPGNRGVQGYGENIWEVKPEKYLEVTTEVVAPTDDELLKAGEEDIIVRGRVENLSQTARLEVGPLLPVPDGNTGLMSLAYGTDEAPDPAELNPIPALELEPGDSELFELRVKTNYSDPRIRYEDGEPVSSPSGGTRAYLEFDPWAIAYEQDGTVRTVRTDPQTEEDRGVKLSEEDANLTISIDDSIPIPETDYALLAAGITKGTAIGLYNSAIGILYGLVDAVKLPYTILRGSWEYQTRVWDSFTEEERALFAEETSFMIVSVLMRNVELAAQDTGELTEQVNQYVYQEMTNLANEWETGDYVSTAEVYSRAAGEAIGSVALPIAMTKLAQTPRAAAAINRAQDALNLRMATYIDQLRRIQYVEDALPLLRALENGTEVAGDAMRALAGVSPEEIAELQRLAQQFEVLITFRSRHASSLQWIKKFGAMMKPEAIKIKSVSKIDVDLGYREGDLGSVVFRKPDVLDTLPDGATDGQVQDAISSFVNSKGFDPGTAEHKEAVERVALRIKEWKKHELEYKEFNDRKYIETEFNYEGNAIPSDKPAGAPKDRTGFKMEETGRPNEWVVKLQDPKDGKFKRVTGDIDPLAFTNLDGTPLTAEQHKALMDAMRESELLRAQHPESATFVGIKDKVEPGRNFVADQFDPGEPGFQLGPNGPARVVRLNPDKGFWNNPRDYNLHWEGGYVHVGGKSRVGPAAHVDPDYGRDITGTVPDRIKPKPFQLGEDGETQFGRCKVRISSAAGAAPVFFDEAGKLTEVSSDGTSSPSEEGAACLVEGPPTTLQVSSGGVVADEPTPRVGGGRRSADAGSSVTLAADGGPVEFAKGQRVAIGVQDGASELRRIQSVSGRTLHLDRAVTTQPGDVVLHLPTRAKVSVRIGAPKGAKVRTLTTVKGSSSAARKVVVSLQRLDAKPKGKRCRVVNKKGKLQIRSAKPSCRLLWISARGTNQWKLRLAKAVPPGKYRVTARAIGLDGQQAKATHKVKVKPKKKAKNKHR